LIDQIREGMRRGVKKEDGYTRGVLMEWNRERGSVVVKALSYKT
jgi:hypothetical protein